MDRQFSFLVLHSQDITGIHTEEVDMVVGFLEFIDDEVCDPDAESVLPDTSQKHDHLKP